MESQTLIKTTWSIDPAHTEVLFKVKHLVISTVTGKFHSFTGKVESENDNFDAAHVEFTIDVNSINTNSEDRDNHLKSADFFDVENHSEITFRNGVLNHKSGQDYNLVGELTIRGTTHTVELSVEYGGTVQDPWGNTKAGFEITGKINRKDFGLTWNTITEAGGMLVGEEVKMEISVQLAAA